MIAAEVHLELCAVYDQNIMSEGSVRQWCRMFKDGQKNKQNVHGRQINKMFTMKSKVAGH
jgi:hypothetical protein